MNSDQLREIQAPLKQLYKDRPERALITLKAEAKAGEGISCQVSTGDLIREAGLHPATGGNGMMLCSGDMLLEALTACAGVTLKAVATAIDVTLSDAHIRAEGDLDFRGTLGVDKETPVGFRDIRLYFKLETEAGEEQIATLLKLTERYCVVYQTLRNGVRVKTMLESGDSLR